MITFEILQNLLIVFNLIVVLFIVDKVLKLKNCDKTIKLISKNLDFISEVHKKCKPTDLSNFVKMYSGLQSISKISESFYVSLFKYDFSKTYVTLKLQLSIKNGIEIVNTSFIDEMPATSNSFSIEVMKSSGFCNMDIDDLKKCSLKVYTTVKSYDVKKIYYKNIEKNGTKLGYISLLYNDDYELDEQQKEEISRISQDIVGLF